MSRIVRSPGWTRARSAARTVRAVGTIPTAALTAAPTVGAATAGTTVAAAGTATVARGTARALRLLVVA